MTNYLRSVRSELRSFGVADTLSADISFTDYYNEPPLSGSESFQAQETISSLLRNSFSNAIRSTDFQSKVINLGTTSYQVVEGLALDITARLRRIGSHLNDDQVNYESIHSSMLDQIHLISEPSKLDAIDGKLVEERELEGATGPAQTAALSPRPRRIGNLMLHDEDITQAITREPTSMGVVVDRVADVVGVDNNYGVDATDLTRGRSRNRSYCCFSCVRARSRSSSYWQSQDIIDLYDGFLQD